MSLLISQLTGLLLILIGAIGLFYMVVKKYDDDWILVYCVFLGILIVGIILTAGGASLITSTICR